MTHANKRMNPIHYGTDMADIRIRINPEIRIWIPDQILALVEFALSEWSCYYYAVSNGLTVVIFYQPDQVSLSCYWLSQ